MLRVTPFTMAVAAISLTVAGCRDAARSLTAPASDRVAMSRALDESAPLVRRIIDPQTTDPEITWVPATNPQLGYHYVWLDPTAEEDSKLLVFMPGTRNTPSNWQLLGQEAARLGYHVIVLMYQNDVGVDAVCKASPDPDCSGNMRLEILDGIDRSSLVAVTPANGINNRLVKLLGYLEDQFPGEGWSKFLKHGEPKWSKIVVAGQSQGAGEAALIGQLHRVNRVAMFSGPPDLRVAGEIDRWVFIGATPARRYFGLFHDQDHLVAGIRANLTALIGQFGDPVQAELNEPPYGGTHIVFTDLRPTLGYAAPNAHQSTARDNNTPIGPDGTPLLRDAWRYLLMSSERNDSQVDEENEDDDNAGPRGKVR